jgi:DNA polymerase-1
MSVLDELRGYDVARGDLVALVVAPGVGVAMATRAGTVTVAPGVDRVIDAAAVVGRVDATLRPRWVMWSNAPALDLAGAGVRLATSWDLAAVSRLLFGGWRAEAARVWAQANDLSLDAIPTTAPPDLFTSVSEGDGDSDDPIRPDGYLRAQWAAGGWSRTLERSARWAELALAVAERQQDLLLAVPDRPMILATARA